MFDMCHLILENYIIMDYV